MRLRALSRPAPSASWPRFLLCPGRAVFLLLALAVFALIGSAQEPNGKRRSKDKSDPAPAIDRKVLREGLTAQPRPPQPAAKRFTTGSEARTAGGQHQKVALEDGTTLYLDQNTALKRGEDRNLHLTAGQIYVEVPPQETGSQEKPLIVQTGDREVFGQGAKFAVRADAQGTEVMVLQGQVHLRGLQDPIHAGQHLLPGADRPTAAPQASVALGWLRELMAAEVPLVPASPHAGGALVVTDQDGQEAPMSLRSYHIDVHIKDGFARTTIDQTYFNHETRQLEGTFYFPLPADASLSRLAMYVDGHLMEGGMAERDHARQVFETIMYTRRDPALLEWVDGTTFRMRVFPLEPRQEKRIILSYTQRLPVQHDRMEYRFPSGHSLGTVRNWSFHARVKDGAPLTWVYDSPRLQATKTGPDLLLDGTAREVTPDRDVVLHLFAPQPDGGKTEVVRFSSAEYEGAKYLMVRFRPDLPAVVARSPRHWVFLFEASGDRDPLLARTQIEIVRALLSRAEAGDTFAVLTANTRVRTFADEPRPVTSANVQAAMTFLERTQLIGSLDLGAALTAAGRLLKASKNEPYLIHLGSGIATLGEQGDDVLTDHVQAPTRYVGMGVGKRWSHSAMRAAAEKTAGYYTRINPDEPIAWRAFELATLLDGPRLLDIRVTDGSGKWTFLPWSRAVVPGEEVCAAARLGSDLDDWPESVVVTGKVNGEGFRRELPVKDVAPYARYLPRTWARLEIDRLLAENNPAENRQKIVALSKAMYVMTPYTSLLVLENDEMYRRFDVDRGRKDHWATYPCPRQIPVVREPIPVGFGSRGADAGEKTTVRKPVDQVLRTMLVRVPMPLLTVPSPTTRFVERTLLNGLDLAPHVYALPDVLTGISRSDPFAGQGPRNEDARSPGGYEGGIGGRSMPTVQGRWPLRWPGERTPLGGVGGIGGAGLGGIAGLGGGQILGAGGPQFPGIGGIGGLPMMLRPQVGAGAAVGAAVDEEPAFGPLWRWLPIIANPLEGFHPKVAGRIRAKLAAPITVEGVRQIPLQEALARLTELTQISFLVDDDAFRDMQINDVKSQVVDLVHVRRVNLATVLRHLLRQVQGTYLIRNDHVEITTLDRAAAIRPFLFYPAIPFGAFPSSGGKAEMAESPAVLGWPSAGWDYLAGSPNLWETGSDSALDELSGVRLDWRSVPIRFGDQTHAAPYRSPEELLGHLTGNYRPPLVLYRRPRLADDQTVFRDLMAYVPGLRTTRADVWAVLEKEATPGTAPELGRIDPRARRLIDKARTPVWSRVSIPPEGGKAALTIDVDGQGRYAYEWVLPWGLRERVLCDGQTLWHLYPELLVGACRPVSRFHLAEFSRLVPWTLPPVEELARGADLVWIDDRTVAVVPRQKGTDRDGGKHTAPSQLYLVTDADGRLTERRLVEMPSGKTLQRETYDNGVVRRLDAHGQEISVRRLTVQAGQTPRLTPDDKDLVVLPMPPRTKEQVFETYQIAPTKDYAELSTELLLALASTELAVRQGTAALEALGKRFPVASLRQLGLVALAASVEPVSNFPWRWWAAVIHLPKQPLAQYVMHLIEADSKRRLDSVNAEGGFLQRLNEFRVLRYGLTAMSNGKKSLRQREAARTQALAYVRRNLRSPLGWALLGILDSEGGGDVAFRRAVVEAYRLFDDIPGLEYAARYEYARGLLAIGRPAEARERFTDLHARALAAGMFPPMDQRFRQALRGDGQEPDHWTAWVRQTAARLIATKHRPLVTALAWQCWVLGDRLLADRLLTDALDQAAGDEERLGTALAGMEYLIQTYQYAKADQVLRSLLARQPWAGSAPLWRLGAMIATVQGSAARQRTCLEQAVECEFRQLPEVIDAEALRNDLGLLLGHYRQMAKALATLEVEPPGDFLAKVVRTTDRWRALAPEDVEVCTAAAWICETVGAHDLAWDYLTTPLARQPISVEGWSTLAIGLQNMGSRELADRAFAALCAADPTDPNGLWLRAANLEAMGRSEAADRHYRQIADGPWPSGWESLQVQAREHLEGR